MSSPNPPGDEDDRPPSGEPQNPPPFAPPGEPSPFAPPEGQLEEQPGEPPPFAPPGDQPAQPPFGAPPPAQPPFGAPPPAQPPYGAPPPAQQPYGAPPGPPAYPASPGQPPVGQPYGQPPYGQPPFGSPQPAFGGAPIAQSQGTSGKAIASLVCGILSVLCFGIIAGIPAIVLGILARKDVAQGRGTGDGLALAGLILGGISIALTIAVIAVAVGSN